MVFTAWEVIIISACSEVRESDAFDLKKRSYFSGKFVSVCFGEFCWWKYSLTLIFHSHLGEKHQILSITNFVLKICITIRKIFDKIEIGSHGKANQWTQILQLTAINYYTIWSTYAALSKFSFWGFVSYVGYDNRFLTAENLNFWLCLGVKTHDIVNGRGNYKEPKPCGWCKQG